MTFVVYASFLGGTVHIYHYLLYGSINYVSIRFIGLREHVQRCTLLPTSKYTRNKFIHRLKLRCISYYVDVIKKSWVSHSCLSYLYIVYGTKKTSDAQTRINEHICRYARNLKTGVILICVICDLYILTTVV